MKSKRRTGRGRVILGIILAAIVIIAISNWKKTPKDGSSGGGTGSGNPASNQPPLGAPARGSEAGDIVDLISQRRIEVAARGSGIENVSLKIRRLIDQSIKVTIPIGTFFASNQASAQNMVATEDTSAYLSSSDWTEINISAACANRPKHIPQGDDSFVIMRGPRQEELRMLMPTLKQAGVGYSVRQAAVWIITDNANYASLGYWFRDQAMRLSSRATES